MLTISKVLLLICLAPAIALAQQPPQSFTVDDVVKMAIRQNPTLSAAIKDVAAARFGARSASALVNPEIVFTPNITNGGSDEEFLLQQRLEINGTRSARKRIADAQLRQTQAQAVVALRALVFGTKAAYYELARARELHSLAVTILKIAEEYDKSTRRQVEVGIRPGIEQTQTGIAVIRARQQVTLAESRVATTLAALNTLVGRAPTESIGALSPLSFSPETLTSDINIQKALETRAEIDVAKAARDVFLQNARLARAEGRLDLAPQLRAESVTRRFTSGIGIAFTLPLVDYGNRRNRIRQAEEEAHAQEDRIIAASNQVRQEVENALIRLRASEAVVKDYQQGVITQAQRLLDASLVGMKTGVTSVLAVLEAQSTYHAVLTEYTNALADHAIARAELERALGWVPADLLPIPASEGKPVK